MPILDDFLFQTNTWSTHPSPPPPNIRKRDVIMDAKEGFTFGCDPEVFIKDNEGRYVSAEGLLPGTKDEPYDVRDKKGEVVGAVQVDGMLGEFTIPPVSTFRDFNRCIEATMGLMGAMLPEGYTIDIVPAVRFEPELFDRAPDKAKMLGCMPDYNAWEGKINPPPHAPDDPYLRTASGHLHVGWASGIDVVDPQHIMNCTDLVKQFDWFLGAWSTRLDPDPTRRKLYGRAGACRLKDYGVEYRVLSNFWIASRERRLAVWNRMQAGINMMSARYYPDKAESYNQMIIDGINSAKVDPQLMSVYRQPLMEITQYM